MHGSEQMFQTSCSKQSMKTRHSVADDDPALNDGWWFMFFRPEPQQNVPDILTTVYQISIFLLKMAEKAVSLLRFSTVALWPAGGAAAPTASPFPGVFVGLPESEHLSCPKTKERVCLSPVLVLMNRKQYQGGVLYTVSSSFDVGSSWGKWF